MLLSPRKRWKREGKTLAASTSKVKMKDQRKTRSEDLWWLEVFLGREREGGWIGFDAVLQIRNVRCGNSVSTCEMSVR